MIKVTFLFFAILLMRISGFGELTDYIRRTFGSILRVIMTLFIYQKFVFFVFSVEKERGHDVVK